MSAARPNANGTVADTKPRYSDGGCVAMYGFCRSGLSPLPILRRFRQVDVERPLLEDDEEEEEAR